MNSLVRKIALAGAVALGALAAAAPALAQELRIGLAAEPSSADPHFHNLTPNNQVARHVFDTLISQDEFQRLGVALATSWKLIDDLTWEFALRPNVKFHDGSPFTADDVIFSFNRVPNVPRSPAPKTSFVRGKTIEKINDLTIRIKTATPYPLMLNDLAQIEIMSAKAAANVTTEDLNAGRGTIGTGPYQFVEFVPGDRLVVKRNDSHWQGKPAWERVTFRFIRSDPTRVAALLSGDVDVIENVPSADVARLKTDNRVAITSALSNRLIYLHLDRLRETSPFVKAKDGSAIKNPFNDLKVRQALSMALNRTAIVDRIMEGEAVVASQLLPDIYQGTSKILKPVAYSVEGARKLLAEAGLPNGFALTIHGPNGRYPNDTKVIEAVAQMFTRIGVETKVETLPPAVFFSRASTGGPERTPEFSMILAGWSAGTGEASGALAPLLGTFDTQAGIGSANRGRYSNARVDEFIKKALATVNDQERAKLLAEGTEIAINDVGLIPIYYNKNTWGARRGIRVIGRTDEYTLAMSMTR
jgi:peptide/nickel transport system substrate-binding protein